jgi:hypothetical protein
MIYILIRHFREEISWIDLPETKLLDSEIDKPVFLRFRYSEYSLYKICLSCFVSNICLLLSMYSDVKTSCIYRIGVEVKIINQIRSTI